MSQPAGNANSSVLGRIKRYGPLVLWMVFISVASTNDFSAVNTSRAIRPLLLWLFPNLSEPQLAVLHFLIRKFAHFAEYAVLGVLSGRAFITSSNAFLYRSWFQVGLLLVVAYALLDEFHQSYEPLRTASIYDSAIDIAGGLTALIFFLLRRKRFRA